LRVLQEREVERLGGNRRVKVDMRVVAATNVDLKLCLARGSLREDFYYRINVIQVHLPPLRDRREDVPLLADHFLEKYTKAAGKQVRGISHEAQELLAEYAWPGNVRELENVIERAVALEQTPLVLPESLPAHVPGGKKAVGKPTATGESPSRLPDITEGFDLEALGEEFYRHYIALALERSGGVQTKAAEMLGMSFRSFRYYAKKLSVK